MIAPRRYLQELVLDPKAAWPDNMAKRDPFLGRLQRAVHGAPSFLVGPGDLAALVRQAVLRCHLANNEPAELRVPSRPPWPDERMWQAHGCTATPVGSGHFQLDVRPWEPNWLGRGAGEVVEDAIRESHRRDSSAVPADPVVQIWTGYRMYMSEGQRQAVHAPFFMPPGDTVVVQLPTGAGKTLAFQLPALVNDKTRGLVFVVTPTVALARDQEERFLTLLAQPGKIVSPEIPLAYHSGLSNETKGLMISAIAGGQRASIPIVFASPEAAVGVLRSALFHAARTGRLRLFVVDEAHVVNQWGHLFRPEFQTLAGLRNALLEACPRPQDRFGTLLLTATLTRDGFDALQQLFGASPEQIVAEPALRPEPGFLLATAKDEEERRTRVLEAVRFLPRPLILYTTRRDDAQDFYDLLRDKKFGASLQRVRLVRGGDLSGPTGERILDGWRIGDVDMIVATSAFGLGVDQANVRSVVHACLPETIDRFYQEVGRSGRDGNASVALLVSTPSDVQAAKGLRGRLITVERGFERWEVMRHAFESVGDDVIRVSLDALPANLHEKSEEGARWNLRTLVLMARAGLIEFVAVPPPEIERAETESNAAFEERRHKVIERTFRTVTLRIIDGGHARREHWDRVVTPKRDELHMADERSLRLVCELRDLRRPLNDLFRDIYTVRELGIEPPRFAGSCPVTRAEDRVDFSQSHSDVMTLSRTRAAVARRLGQVLDPRQDPGRRVWMAYDASPGDRNARENLRRRMLDFLRYAVTDGIAEVCTSASLLPDKSWEDLIARSPYRFLVRSSISGPAFTQNRESTQLPCVTILDSDDAQTKAVNGAARLERPFHVIVLPRHIPDPRRPDRLFFDVRDHRNLNEVLYELDRWES